MSEQQPQSVTRPKEARRWTKTTKELPPEGVEVDTLSPGGIQQTLVREGRLWFYPDHSMWVYYEPAFWSPLNAQL